MCQSLNIEELVQACAVLYVLRVSIFGFGKCFVLTQTADVGFKPVFCLRRLMQDYIRHGLCWVCQIVSGLSVLLFVKFFTFRVTNVFQIFFYY